MRLLLQRLVSFSVHKFQQLLFAMFVLSFLLPDTFDVMADERCLSDDRSCSTAPQKAAGNVQVIVTPSGISPEHVRIDPGTTVIWVNDAPGEIRVVFPERKISTTCQDSRGFVLGNAGIERSETLARGDIATLCPLEANTYEYEVEYFEPRGASAELALRRVHGAISVD